MNEEFEGAAGPKFSPNLWKSVGRHPRELTCERAFYQRHVDVSPSPSVMYRFVAESKSRGHGAQRATRKESERREKKSEMRGGYLDEDIGQDRPFTSSLRRKFQLDSKEALCLLGLKKKIARLYAQDMERQDEDQRLPPKSHHGRKRSTCETEAIPVKRKRGRPPKNKNKTEITKPDSVEGRQWKCVSRSGEPLKVRISRSKSEEVTKDVTEVAAPVMLRPPRRARPSERSLLIDSRNSSSSSSECGEEGQGEEGEKEEDVDAKGLPDRRNVFDDEALALQLHLDLNRPMLRRRRRSGGLMSPSSSEQ